MSDAVSFDAQKHQSLERSFAQIFDAIDYSVSNGLHPPAFILVYSTMDIASSLDTDEPRVGEGFKAWLDKYVLPGTSLKCNAVDLWAGRCGIVHAYSAESDLSAKGQSKEAWLRVQAGSRRRFGGISRPQCPAELRNNRVDR